MLRDGKKCSFVIFLQIPTGNGLNNVYLQASDDNHRQNIGIAIHSISESQSHVKIISANNEEILVNRDLISIFSSILRELLTIKSPEQALYLPDFSSVHIKHFFEILSFGSTTKALANYDQKEVRDVAKLFLNNVECEEIICSDFIIHDLTNAVFVTNDETIEDCIQPNEKNESNVDEIEYNTETKENKNKNPSSNFPNVYEKCQDTS